MKGNHLKTILLSKIDCSNQKLQDPFALIVGIKKLYFLLIPKWSIQYIIPMTESARLPVSLILALK
jgi:hypothetical protein